MFGKKMEEASFGRCWSRLIGSTGRRRVGDNDLWCCIRGWVGLWSFDCWNGIGISIAPSFTAPLAVNPEDSSCDACQSMLKQSNSGHKHVERRTLALKQKQAQEHVRSSCILLTLAKA